MQHATDLSLRDLESGNSCLAQLPGPAKPLSQDANPRRMINSTPAPALNTFIHALPVFVACELLTTSN